MTRPRNVETLVDLHGGSSWPQSWPIATVIVRSSKTTPPPLPPAPSSSAWPRPRWNGSRAARAKRHASAAMNVTDTRRGTGRTRVSEETTQRSRTTNRASHHAGAAARTGPFAALIDAFSQHRAEAMRAALPLRPRTAATPATEPRVPQCRIRGWGHRTYPPMRSSAHSPRGAGDPPRMPRSGADISALLHPAPHLTAPTATCRHSVLAVTESSPRLNLLSRLGRW